MYCNRSKAKISICWSLRKHNHVALPDTDRELCVNAQGWCWKRTRYDRTSLRSPNPDADEGNLWPIVGCSEETAFQLARDSAVQHYWISQWLTDRLLQPRCPRTLRCLLNRPHDQNCLLLCCLLVFQPEHLLSVSKRIKMMKRWTGDARDDQQVLTMHSADSKQIKHRLTLWQESLPLSSTPRMILCFINVLLTDAIHFSICLFN